MVPVKSCLDKILLLAIGINCQVRILTASKLDFNPPPIWPSHSHIPYLDMTKLTNGPKWTSLSNLIIENGCNRVRNTTMRLILGRAKLLDLHLSFLSAQSLTISIHPTVHAMFPFPSSDVISELRMVSTPP
jgi:hypothetical protein